MQSERLSAKVNACAQRAAALFFKLSGPAALIFSRWKYFPIFREISLALAKIQHIAAQHRRENAVFRVIALASYSVAKRRRFTLDPLCEIFFKNENNICEFVRI
ncbi:hypothetical protein OL229_11950 [Neisseriaceae bacterium JH1-16]|nr:hypothetical protein [Neisseriaceae bacterium JH1-16]